MAGANLKVPPIATVPGYQSKKDCEGVGQELPKMIPTLPARPELGIQMTVIPTYCIPDPPSGK